MTRSEERPGLTGREEAAWKALGARFRDRQAEERTRRRTQAAHARLLADSIEGDDSLAEVLHVQPSAVPEMIRSRSIFAFEDHDGTRHYPRWQLTETGTVPHLPEVRRSLDNTLHPLTVTHWFCTPDPDLTIDSKPQSPRSWLVAGAPPQVVVDLARDL